MLKKLIFLMLALCATIATPPAEAVMESHPHELELADRATLDQIIAIPDGRDFVGGTGKVYAEGDGRFIIARVEDDTCYQEYCPTAFISVRESGSKIIGFGWLPGRLLYGDVVHRECRACGEVYEVYFVDSKDKFTSVGISDDYLVIPGNPE